MIFIILLKGTDEIVVYERFQLCWQSVLSIEFIKECKQIRYLEACGLRDRPPLKITGISATPPPTTHSKLERFLKGFLRRIGDGFNVFDFLKEGGVGGVLP